MVQQQFGQAVWCMQTAWVAEGMGNPAGAGPLYQQAVECLTGCVQMTGANTPAQVFYLLGNCQVRLAALNHAAGCLQWAQQWLALAQQSFQAAWQAGTSMPGGGGYPGGGVQNPVALPGPGAHGGNLGQTISTWLGVANKALDVCRNLGLFNS
jgi:hypothetical protein